MSGCASQLNRARDSPWFIDSKKVAILPARFLLLNLHLQDATLLSYSGPDSRSLESFHFVGKFECIGRGGAHGVQKLNSATS